MTSRARTVALAAALLLVSARATAEPALCPGCDPERDALVVPEEFAPPVSLPAAVPTAFLHMRKATTLVRDGVVLRELPPGYFLDDASFTKLDAELRRLQTIETRLTAENEELREGVAGWQPGWKLLTFTLVAGLLGGGYAYHRLSD